MKASYLLLAGVWACGESNVDRPDAVRRVDAPRPPDARRADAPGVDAPPQLPAIHAVWSLRTVAGAPVEACPPGVTTAGIYTDNETYSFRDLYVCSAGQGTTSELPPGTYTTYVILGNSGLTTEYVRSLPYQVTVSASPNPVHVEYRMVIDGGYFGLRWTVNGQAAGTGCGAAGAPTTSVLSTVTGGSMGYEDLFDCVDGAAYTAPLLAGSYAVSVAALNSDNLAVGTAPTLVNRAIQTNNTVTDLGTINIPLN